MANQHHNTQHLSKIFITIFYPCLIFLSFLPEAYLPIESPFRQHMLRLATCFTLMTLCSIFLHDLRFQIVSTVVETIALLGALFMPPDDPAFEANPFGNPDKILYEPYMVLDEWVGSPGNGWALSFLALFIAYFVQVSVAGHHAGASDVPSFGSDQEAPLGLAFLDKRLGRKEWRHPERKR